MNVYLYMYTLNQVVEAVALVAEMYRYGTTKLKYHHMYFLRTGTTYVPEGTTNYKHYIHIYFNVPGYLLFTCIYIQHTVVMYRIQVHYFIHVHVLSYIII